MAMILFVDDGASFFKDIAASLADRGYDVAVAADGPAAVAQCRLRRPDLVCLPVRGGMQTIRNLRSEHPALPIIALSVREDAAHFAPLFKGGPTHFVRRPRDDADFASTVADVLNDQLRIGTASPHRSPSS